MMAAYQPLTKTTGERSQVSADIYGQGWGGDRAEVWGREAVSDVSCLLK